MASNITISIPFKIEDIDGGFKQLTIDAKGLKAVMEQNLRRTNEN